MNLFPCDPKRNLLPGDGTVNYYGPILNPREALHYYQTLLETIPWESDKGMIAGRPFVTARKVAWYGNQRYSYAYSGTVKAALPWTNELLSLKAIIEGCAGVKFNSCLLNLYHHGSEGMGWHSDDEKMLGESPTIASLSLGAERKFSFRHKCNRQTLSLFLEDGSLLVMKDSTQAHWQHCILKSKKITTSRINLTFRTIVPESHPS